MVGVGLVRVELGGAGHVGVGLDGCLVMWHVGRAGPGSALAAWSVPIRARRRRKETYVGKGARASDRVSWGTVGVSSSVVH